MPEMTAGALRHWVTFEMPGPIEQDSDGALVETWVDAFATNSRMPCEVVALAGRELLAAQAMAARVTTRIRTRFRPGFDAVQRATHSDGTIYNIDAVIADPDSRIRWVTLLAHSGTDAGGSAA
jgi:SPP1 family predicted phage head-tail adaptor